MTAPALGSGPWWEACLRAIAKGFTLRGVDVVQAVMEITRDEAGSVAPAVVLNISPLEGALVCYQWPGLEPLMFGRAPADGPSGSVDMWKQVDRWPAHGDCTTPAEVAWAWAWAPGNFDDGTPKPCPIERELASAIVSNGPDARSPDLTTREPDHAAGTSLAAPTTAADTGGSLRSEAPARDLVPPVSPALSAQGTAKPDPSPSHSRAAASSGAAGVATGGTPGGGERPTERPDPSMGAGPAGPPAASCPAVTSDVVDLPCPLCGKTISVPCGPESVFPREKRCYACNGWIRLVRVNGVVAIERDEKQPQGNPLAAAMPAPAPMPGTLFGDVAPTKPKRKRTTKASPKATEHAPEEA